MITEVVPNLFVADMDGHGNDPEVAYLHACKSPCHQHAVGYTKSLPNTHPNYLALEQGNHLFLNLVDPPVPLFKLESFQLAQAFIDKHIQERPVVIHCNQGMSRSPSLALVHLFRHQEFDEATRQFRAIYPFYQPGVGITQFLRANWGALRPPT